MVLAYVQRIYVSDLWLLRSCSMMQTNATPLVWAVNFAKTTVVVELLIKAKADVNADGMVCVACQYNLGVHMCACHSWSVLSPLIVKKKRTPLILAAAVRPESPALVDLLLKSKADVNARDSVRVGEASIQVFLIFEFLFEPLCSNSIMRSTCCSSHKICMISLALPKMSRNAK